MSDSFLFRGSVDPRRLLAHILRFHMEGFVVNVSEAARGGSELELLIAMRDRVADAVADPECPKRDLASLTLRLSNIVKEIKALESAEGGDDIGEATSVPDAEFDPEAI